METQWRDLAVVLDGTAQGDWIGRHAAALARRHGAHLVGIYGVGRSAFPAPAATFARGSSSMGEVAERQRALNADRIVAAGQAFSTIAYDYQVSSEFRIVWRDLEYEDAALRTLHCDLIVTARSAPKDLPPDWDAEHILFSGGAPVLVIPDGWTSETIGDTVVIGWNGSREVRRAVNDAMPFLRGAKAVTVLTVDPRHLGEDPAGGTEVVRHLEQHGVVAEHVSVDSAGAEVGDDILRSASELGADLLVIGAYSRPRTAERMFGGVTRTLLRRPSVPVFVSR